ncbi:MAG: hypothetical protein GXO85_04985 [Chlorobi bacterium]|nr:hypothetical protein [Chlorobiota bacterium]
MVNGELYTIVLNKDARGRKGSIAALIKGTKGKDIAEAITKKVSFLVRLWWIKIKECSVLNLVDFYSSFESTFFRTLQCLYECK